MTLPSLLGIAVAAAILVGLVGALFVALATVSRPRLVGALLFALLLPAAIGAVWVSTSSAGLTQFSPLVAGVVALVLYLVVGYVSIIYVQRTAGTPQKLEMLQPLQEEVQRLRGEVQHLNEAESLKRPLKPAKRAASFALKADGGNRRLVIVQGGIADILDRVVRPEIVVNSENDYMMPGRPFDKNMSGALRYLDAVKDQGDRIVEDPLNDKLRVKVPDSVTPVKLGKVYETETTGLRNRGVKFVFHVATVQPRATGGYIMNRDELSHLLPTCVSNCFQKYGDLLKEGRLTDGSTILFPLIGAGDGNLSSQDSARWMVTAIVEQMKRYRGIQETYIVAFRKSDLQALHEMATSLSQDLVEEAPIVGEA